jgi:transposase
MLDTPLMRELSVAEQRYQAVLAVISGGVSVSQVAQKVGMSRQTARSWLARYEAHGVDRAEWCVPSQPIAARR